MRYSSDLNLISDMALSLSLEFDLSPHKGVWSFKQFTKWRELYKSIKSLNERLEELDILHPSQGSDICSNGCKGGEDGGVVEWELIPYEFSLDEAVRQMLMMPPSQGVSDA